MHSSAVAFVIAALVPAAAVALQDASAPEDIALTIGADGTAAVREVRSAQLVAGDNRIRIYDVSPQIQAESVAVRSLATPELLELREQAVWFEVLDPDRALERLAGRPASLFRWHDGVQEKLEGRLLFPPIVPGPEGEIRVPLYLEQQDGKIRLLDAAEVELDALPPGDWNRTRVDWRVACKRPDRYRFELTYLTGGLSWRADASLRLSAGGETGDVAFVATIRNDTGISWRQARVGFLEAEAPVADARRPDGDRASAQFHGFDDAIALEARRSVQVVLASAHEVPVVATPTLFISRELQGGADTGTAPAAERTLAVRRRFDVVNAAGKGLGRALPAATARTLLVDAKNRPVPAGSIELAAAAQGETLSFAGPIEPGLVARVSVLPEDTLDTSESIGGARKPNRTIVVDLWSERAVATTVDLLIALDPAERVVSSTLPADVARAGLARIALPVAAHAQARARFNLSRP